MNKTIILALLMITSIGLVTSYDGDFCTETNSPCGGGCTSIDLTSMYNGYDFDTDPSSVGNITGWNTSCITSMRALFANSNFNQDISGWDTSAVTDMSIMFGKNSVFNQNIGGWNTGAVTTMNSMFNQASAFNQDIGSWDTSSVTDMSRMFGVASAFNQDIDSWDTSTVTTMAAMFYNAISFEQNLSNWNFGNVYDMNNMFNGVTLSTPNYDELLNAISYTSGVSGVIFNGGNSLYSINGLAAHDILTNNGWTITDGGPDSTICSFCTETCSPCGGGCTATDLTSMYSGYDFVSDPSSVGDISGWDTSCIVSMNELFISSNFNQDISGWDVSQVTDMENMFYNTPFNQDISGWNTGNVVIMTGMFGSNTVFNQPIGFWNTNSVTQMDGMFSGASAFNQDLNGWNVDNVLYFADMFSQAVSYDYPLSSWTLGSVVDMSNMFNGVTLSTTNYDATLNNFATTTQSGINFDGGNSQYSSTGKVGRDILTDTYSWTITDGGQVCSFCTESCSPCGGGCNTTSFSSDYDSYNFVTDPLSVGNISGWNTSCITGMYAMFAGSNFNQDISGWDTHNVLTFNQMFAWTPFNQNIGSWNTSSANDMQGMFRGSPFNQNIGGWDTRNVLFMNEMFRDNTVFNQPLNSWNTRSVTDMRYMFYSATAFNQNISGWNVSQVTTMDNMFTGVTLSTSNYDALLNGWASRPVQDSVPFSGGDSKYTDIGYTSRGHLTTTHSWNITDGGLDILGNGSISDPYQITNCVQLKYMNISLSSNYILMNNIDCAGYNWTALNLAGSLNGQGYTINNLTIPYTGGNYYGLFGQLSGNVSNLNINGVMATLSGGQYFGAIAGTSSGNIINCNSTITISRGGSQYVGGLVAYNTGNIINSSALGGQTYGTNYVGGIVGYNTGNITGCIATGGARAAGSGFGGLVGINTITGIIRDSISSGVVSNSPGIGAGLVGTNDGTIINSSTSCTGNGGGGFVNSNSGNISQSRSTGSVSCGTTCAGFVNSNSGRISDSYATGTLSTNNGGGFVATNTGVISNCYSLTVNNGGGSNFGGFVGINNGNINTSYTTGSFNTGSTGGGFVGTNNGNITSCNASGNFGRGAGFAYINGVNGNIIGSVASGGSSSDPVQVVGGFVGTNNGIINNCRAASNVQRGGGFANVNAITGIIINSYSTSTLGANSGSAGFIVTNNGIINNSYTSPGITSGTTGAGFVTGNYGNITNSYVNHTSGFFAVGGGFANVNAITGIINKSYVIGTVTAIAATPNGGFVKVNDGIIDNSYTRKNAGSGNGNTAGFANINTGTILNSYSTGTTNISQGFAAFNNGTCTNSYWDTTIGGNTSACGTGKTTTQMNTQATFTGWNFVDIWQVCPLINDGYPAWIELFCPCIPNWIEQYTPTICPSNNLWTKTYTDTNMCGTTPPIDNGTIQDCIYIPPQYNNQTFDDKTTTDLNNVPNITAVENFTVSTETSSIQWITPVNLENVTNVETVILQSAVFVSVDVITIPDLNTPAAVAFSVPTTWFNQCKDFTLYYAPGYYTTSGDIVQNGVLVATGLNVGGDCIDPTICTNVQCVNGILTFDAAHFDSFSLGEVDATTVNSCRGTKTTVYAGFAIIAILLVALSAFFIISSFSGGNIDVATIASILIGLSVIIMIGYIVIYFVSNAVCG